MSNLLLQLSDAVVNMDEIASAYIAQEIIDKGLDINDAIENGLVLGMQRAGDLFEQEEYFISELLICADAMNAAMEVFKPYIKAEEKKSKGRVVIGTIFGDTHDIGKNIVALMIQSAGFDVLDLGRDVTAREFVDQAVNYNADIIAISTLMTTTMNNMEDIVKLLKAEGKRDMFRVIIGGKPCSNSFAKKIGADFYSATASGALRLVKKIMKCDDITDIIY